MGCCANPSSMYPKMSGLDPDPGKRAPSSSSRPQPIGPFGYRFHWTDIPLSLIVARGIFIPIYTILALHILPQNAVVFVAKILNPVNYYYYNVTWQLDTWFSVLVPVVMPLVWLSMARILLSPNIAKAGRQTWIIMAYCLWDQAYNAYVLANTVQDKRWRSVWDLVMLFGCTGVCNMGLLLVWLGGREDEGYREPWLAKLEGDMRGVLDERREVKTGVKARRVVKEFVTSRAARSKEW